MANDLRQFLDLAKQAHDITTNNAPAPQRHNTFVNEGNIITRDNFDEKIAEFDDKVFGKLQEQKEKSGYSAEEELKRIKSRANENVNTNIHNPILQEVINNPYEFDVETMAAACNPGMKRLEEKLSKQNFAQSFSGGIEAAKAITKNLEDFDKQKRVVNERQETQGQVVNEKPVSSQKVSVDYEMIKMIVENAIDKKLSQISSLNENRQYNKSSNASIIMLGENSFTFVDDSGNMYECSGMKYKGKMKLRKK